MSIHREGYKILIFGFILLILFNVLLWIILPGNTLIRWLAVLFSLMMYTFLLFFFRLPARRLDPDPGLVYAPADGKVVVVEETEEKEYFRDLRL